VVRDNGGVAPQKNAEGRPFVDGGIFVHSAIFAAYFGEPNVENRMYAPTVVKWWGSII